MRQARDTVWQRRGTSWIWDEEARNQVCAAREVWSLRGLLRAVGQWPDDLPSNDNNTLVVAGLDGCLDLLAPADAESWLGDAIKDAMLSFQSYYEGEAALIFWLPSGQGRLKVNPATEGGVLALRRPPWPGNPGFWPRPLGSGGRLSAGGPAARGCQARRAVPSAHHLRPALGSGNRDPVSTWRTDTPSRIRTGCGP